LEIIDTVDTAAELLRTFRVRAVRIGVAATGLAIVSLAVFPLLPGAPEVDVTPYAALVMAASVGAAVVALLPWPTMLQTRAGDYVFYTWSALDIGLIALVRRRAAVVTRRASCPISPRR